MVLRLLTVAACVLACTACSSEDRSDVVTEQRKLPDFSKITAGGALEMDIKVGSPQSVTIECNKDSMADVDSVVNDNELTISVEDDAKPTHLSVHIVVPKLESLELNGSTNAVVAGVSSKSFELDTAGSSKVKAQGEVDDLDMELSGSSNVELTELKSKNCDITISGSGNANIFANQSVDANISGAGSIKIHGNPAKVNQQISGSGTIQKL
ncbi:MAG: DUF2807 domain-containing protein [Candidatus Obscuribacterales bacterium]|nr:DUF2807 domain-containing protein [Candidatus Obscuribacterales bacterium]